MTIGLPNFVDRPDRVRACTVRHDGPCEVCGFDGIHFTWAQTLERRQFRGACMCVWYGPIRQFRGCAVADTRDHRSQ